MSLAGDAAFSCRRALAPMLWVLLALSLIELAAVHLLVAALWSGRAALVLSAVTLPAIGWILWAIGSLSTRPVLVGPDRVLLRAGAIAGLEVARGDIAGVRDAFDGAVVKARSTLRLSLAAWPNLLVELARPYRARGRDVERVALRLDDPVGFAAALNRRRSDG